MTADYNNRLDRSEPSQRDRCGGPIGGARRTPIAGEEDAQLGALP